MSVVRIVCFQLEVSASGRSFIQSSPTDFGMSECDREASIMRRSSRLGAVPPWGHENM